MPKKYLWMYSDHFIEMFRIIPKNVFRWHEVSQWRYNYGKNYALFGNGKTAQVSILNDGEVGFGSTEYIVFRAKEGIADKDYLYYLVCSPEVREPAIKSMVGSSGRQRVQADVVKISKLRCRHWLNRENLAHF